MTKYLVSAAVAAVMGAAAFATPSAAQVGFSVNVGPDRPYYGYGYDGPRYYHSRPGVRVYSGRSAYRDDCRTKRVVKWRNGQKIVTTRRVCD